MYAIVAVFLLAGVFFYFSRRVLTPFFIALALAYLLDPVTDRLESLKISRTLSVLILMVGVFSLLFGTGLLIFPILKIQAEHLVHNLPNYMVVVEKWESLDALNAHLVAPHMGSYREQVKDLVAGMTLQVLQPA